ncbi:hypothetical protein [Niabella ginsenosidivorans]|nr:hypothetical protein [Niabella ginsenosidivorans]
MKKIQEQEKNEQKQAPELKIAKQEIVSLQPSFTLTFSHPLAANTRSYCTVRAGTPVKRSYAIFHPPCSLS